MRIEFCRRFLLHRFGLAALVAFSLFALLPANGLAENCAWLNAATAGGVLGADASVSVARAHPDDDDAVCTFIAQPTGGSATLAVAVHTLESPAADYQQLAKGCGAEAVPLRAVGNEAVECSEPGENHTRMERVIGRVRNRAFMLTWTMPEPESGPNAVTPNAIREKMRNLAEEIAGSLF